MATSIFNADESVCKVLDQGRIHRHQGRIESICKPRLGQPKVTKKHNLPIKRLKMKYNFEKKEMNPTPELLRFQPLTPDISGVLGYSTRPGFRLNIFGCKSVKKGLWR